MAIAAPTVCPRSQQDLAVRQAAGLHLVPDPQHFHYASRRDRHELARDLMPVYTAPNAEMAGVRFDEFVDKRGAQ